MLNVIPCVEAGGSTETRKCRSSWFDRVEEGRKDLICLKCGNSLLHTRFVLDLDRFNLDLNRFDLATK